MRKQTYGVYFVSTDVALNRPAMCEMRLYSPIQCITFSLVDEYGQSARYGDYVSQILLVPSHLGWIRALLGWVPVSNRIGQIRVYN